MIKLFIFAALIFCAVAAPHTQLDEKLSLATECDPTKCVLPNCRCSNTDTPGGLDVKTIPQLVYFTFDDAVTISNFDYYEEAFFNKKNPDGCPVQATYFISHEYTDYSLVHELHARGHEVALHSITHKSSTDYWKKLSLEEEVAEFGGDLELMSHFANIDKTSIKGARLPLLQLAGNNSFEAIKKVGLTYDCSWPTLKYLDPGLWPYTLDYASTQDCPVGPCPTASLPGVWVSPMVDWLDESGTKCAMVDACANVTETVDAFYNFMINNFDRHYKGNKAPFGFYVHAAWFGKDDGNLRWAAYKKFVDYLVNLKDVYLVSVSRGLEWVRNPRKIEADKPLWDKCPTTYTPKCDKKVCKLVTETGEERYMTSCVSCPRVYPWLGNPLGK